jgi:hypothetical protein
VQHSRAFPIATIYFYKYSILQGESQFTSSLLCLQYNVRYFIILKACQVTGLSQLAILPVASIRCANIETMLPDRWLNAGCLLSKGEVLEEIEELVPPRSNFVLTFTGLFLQTLYRGAGQCYNLCYAT